MAGKRGSNESSWRPLAKLSGLIGRQSSVKSKKSLAPTAAPAPAHDDKGLYRFGSESSASGPDTSFTFQPLAVDLSEVQKSNLGDGWLDEEKKEPSKERKIKRKSLRKPDPDSSTPIADLFVSKSVLDLTLTAPEGTSTTSGQDAADNSKRPVPAFDQQQTMTYQLGPSDTASGGDVSVTGSILDRGRPVEPRVFATDAPEDSRARSTTKRSSLAANEPPVLPSVSPRAPSIRDSEPRQEDRQSRARAQPTWEKPKDKSITPPAPPSMPAQAPAQRRTSSTNRHSMYGAGNSAPKPATVESRPPLSARSSSAAPSDRIKTWQKSVTSAPNSTPSPGVSPDPAATSSFGGQPRRVSSRGVASDRLAWIRELEEKKSGAVNRDVGVFKKAAGSVSDKLAMFENKNTLTTPATTRLPPLTRSNSTTSRLSWAGVDSAGSVHGNAAAATPRTSFETNRSSHRASSVMSHYDDSFRERMESVATSYPNDKPKGEAGKAEAPKPQRLSSQFVPLKASSPGKDDQSPALEQEAERKSSTETATKEVPATAAAEEPSMAGPAMPLATEPILETKSESTPKVIPAAVLSAIKSANSDEAAPVETNAMPSTTTLDSPSEQPALTPSDETSKVIDVEELAVMQSGTPAVQDVAQAQVSQPDTPVAVSEAPLKQASEESTVASVPQEEEPRVSNLAPALPEAPEQDEPTQSAPEASLPVAALAEEEPKAQAFSEPFVESALQPESQQERQLESEPELKTEQPGPETNQQSVPEPKEALAQLFAPATPAATLDEASDAQDAQLEVDMPDVATIEHTQASLIG